MKGFSNMGQKMMSRFFRPVDNVVWDLMSGKVGIRTEDGIVSLEGKGNDAQVNLNMFDDFGMALPAFAQNTPVKDIKEGDLIYNARKVVGWVIGLPTDKKKSFQILKPNGESGAWTPPKVTSMGLDLSGAMVLRSLVNTLPEGGLGNLQGMLMPLMMMGDGDMSEMGDMLPMLLMSQLGMGGMDASAGGNMLQTMMMMKMMGSLGKGGSGGKGSFFDKGGF